MMKIIKQILIGLGVIGLIMAVVLSWETMIMDVFEESSGFGVLFIFFAILVSWAIGRVFDKEK